MSRVYRVPAFGALWSRGTCFRWPARGLRSTFANAYPDLSGRLASGKRRPSVTTCAVSAAGLRFRHLADLERDRAVTWDIVRDRFSEHVGKALSPVTAEEAGRHLAAIANRYRLTVYETFITDLAGHGRLGFTAAETVARIDGLLAGVVEGKRPATTVLVTSDHGNFEESRHRRHTRNPVPLLVVGPLARCFVGVQSILEITPRILACLEESE